MKPEAVADDIERMIKDELRQRLENAFESDYSVDGQMNKYTL